MSALPQLLPPTRGVRRPWTRAEESYLAGLYRDPRLSVARLRVAAIVLGRSVVALRLRAVRLGLVQRPRPVTEAEIARWRALRAAGLTWRAIGRECERDHHTIADYLTR
jgi:hypothetical protein